MPAAVPAFQAAAPPGYQEAARDCPARPSGAAGRDDPGDAFLVAERQLADAGRLLPPMLDRLTWSADRLDEHRTRRVGGVDAVERLARSASGKLARFVRTG